MSLAEILRRYEKMRPSLKVKQAREFWTHEAKVLTSEEKREVALLLAKEDRWSYTDLISSLLENAFVDGADPLEYLQELEAELGEEGSALLAFAHSIANGLGNQGTDVLRRGISEEGVSPFVKAGFFASWIERKPGSGIPALVDYVEAAKTSEEATAYVETVIASSFPDNIEAGRIADGLRVAESLLPAGLLSPLVDGFASLYRVDPKRCHDELLRLTESEVMVQIRLASRVALDSRLSVETREALLDRLSASDQIDILDSVVAGVAHVGHLDPEWAMDLLLGIVEREYYYRLTSFDYAFSELGKADSEGCMSRLETWIPSKPSWDRFFGPDIAVALMSSKPNDLIPWIEKWLESGSELQTAALHSVRKHLSHGWKSDSTNTLAEKILPLLELVANEEAIAEAGDLPKEWDTATFRCLVIAKETLHPPLTVDPADVIAGWMDCGALRLLMKEDWVEEEVKSQRTRHPLSYILASSASEKDDRWKARAETILRYLDELAEHVDPTEKGSKTLREGLRNRRQFWQAVSEMEVVARLRRKGFEVELQPLIDTPQSGRARKLDARATILANEVFFEVATPETYIPLQVVQAAVGLPNRAVRIILDKVRNQLDGADNLGDKPVVLVIDVSRSEIDAYDVTDALAGQFKVRYWFDKKQGRAVFQDYMREMNAISDKTEAGQLLSGVFLTSRKGAGIRTSGQWIPNKNARAVLGDKLRKLVEEALIDDSPEEESP